MTQDYIGRAEAAQKLPRRCPKRDGGKRPTAGSQPRSTSSSRRPSTAALAWRRGRRLAGAAAGGIVASPPLPSRLMELRTNLLCPPATCPDKSGRSRPCPVPYAAPSVRSGTFPGSAPRRREAQPGRLRAAVGSSRAAADGTSTVPAPRRASRLQSRRPTPPTAPPRLPRPFSAGPMGGRRQVCADRKSVV